MLARPWLMPLIVAGWAISMHWLVTAKVVPSWHENAPPGNQIFYSTENRLIPVAWTVLWNDVPVGYSISQAARLPDRGLEVTSLLHFDFMPLDEMVPLWLQNFIDPERDRRITIPFDARGSIVFNHRGAIQKFTSRVDIPGSTGQIRLSGTVDNSVVKVTVDAHGVVYEVERRLPDEVMIGDELSPQATIPGLAVGRRWTVPTYSPLRPAGSPIEMLHAHVVGEQMFFWQDTLTRVHEVRYQTDPTAPHHDPRFTMLVDMNDRVLKQDSIFLGARLTFIRRPDEDAEQLAARIEEEHLPQPGLQGPASEASSPSRSAEGETK